jgi:hypothetical protein
MRTLLTRAAAPALLALSLVGLSGCALLQPEAEPAVRDESSGEIVESSDADVFSLRVGDCMVDTLSDELAEVSSVPTVPCSEPHDSEAFASTAMPDGEYPGDDAVIEAADTYCYDEFATFVGMSYDESVLEMSSLFPTQQSWDLDDDREILCLVVSADGQVTGTLAGAAR